MKKFYKIFLLIIIFFFLSTYNPNRFQSVIKKENSFFEVKNIEITDTVLIQEDEINNKIQKIYGKNIFFIKKNEVAQPLSQIDFLSKIEVKKKFPDKLVIKIFETKPVAVLFKEERKYILDSSANLITIKENIQTDRLPRVFGNGAEKNFIYFIELLQKNNFKINKIKNYYFFQIGRWDIELLNGKIIKFPFEKLDDAIIKSTELLKRKDFENYKIIDLRINGKIITQ